MLVVVSALGITARNIISNEMKYLFFCLVNHKIGNDTINDLSLFSTTSTLLSSGKYNDSSH
jgi:hypothetical protein